MALRSRLQPYAAARSTRMTAHIQYMAGGQTGSLLRISLPARTRNSLQNVVKSGFPSGIAGSQLLRRSLLLLSPPLFPSADLISSKSSRLRLTSLRLRCVSFRFSRVFISRIASDSRRRVTAREKLVPFRLRRDAGG